MKYLVSLPSAAPLLGALAATLLAGCNTMPLGFGSGGSFGFGNRTSQVPPPAQPAPAVVAQAELPAQVSSVDPASLQSGGASQAIFKSKAIDARAYRADAAGHLYGLHQTRIFKGRMPPLLYAVGVLQVDVDGASGQVINISWMREPKHAPEVVAEIEKMIRNAAPFPTHGLGKVTYTDTWLWHKSGRFQLDTLTEGQN